MCIARDLLVVVDEFRLTILLTCFIFASSELQWNFRQFFDNVIPDVINWTSPEEGVDAMLYVARCNVEIIKSMEKKVRYLKKETDQLKQETNLL